MGQDPTCILSVDSIKLFAKELLELGVLGLLDQLLDKFQIYRFWVMLCRLHLTQTLYAHETFTVWKQVAEHSFQYHIHGKGILDGAL